VGQTKKTRVSIKHFYIHIIFLQISDNFFSTEHIEKQTDFSHKYVDENNHLVYFMATFLCFGLKRRKGNVYSLIVNKKDLIIT